MEDNSIQDKKNGARIITSVFVFIILAIFPLFYTDYYYNILVTKYYFYCACVMILMVLILAYILYKLFSGNTDEKSIKIILRRFTVPEYFMIAFLIVNIISTIQSDYLYESFWGNEGRYSGLFLWLLYGMTFLIISRFFDLRRWHLDFFLIAAMLACLFSITDFFQMDILGFKEGMNPIQKPNFTSTIGNINTFSAYAVMITAIAVTLFTKETEWKRSLWYYVCVVISFFALILCNSDSAYIGLAVLFGFLPLFLFKNWLGIKRYALVLTTFFTVTQIIDLICQYMRGKVLWINSLYSVFINYSKLSWIVIGCWIVTGLLYVLNFYNKKRRADKFVLKAWLVAIIIVSAILGGVLIDVNLIGHVDRYGSLGQYLHFDVHWGTNRGYIWKLAIDNYRQFPLMHKLFGYGPDTFGIITVTQNYNDMVFFDGQVYDSVHNEFLQYFITLGPFGLITYLGTMISSGVVMIKKVGKQPLVIAVFMAVACYLAQAVVNISIPIVAPIMLTLLAAGLAGSKKVDLE